MTVLLLTDADVFAGTERHIAELARSLHERGVAVSVGCPGVSPLADSARAAGIEVRPIEKGGAIDFPAISAIATFLREGPDRIVHCHNGRTVLQAAIAKSRVGHGAVVLTQHFLSPSYATRTGPKRWISDAIHRYSDRRVDHVIAISDAVRQGVIERGEALPENVTRVHNGMAAKGARAADDPASIASVRERLGVAAGAPLVVCAARLEAEKRVDVLIDAMAVVVRQRPETRCVVAGQGRDRPTLQARIESLGLAGAVTLLGFRDDVRELIGAGDVFVMVCEKEAFGLVFLEAMETAVPVIATDAGGPREIVVQGETGWLVPPRDADALGHAILNAIDDPIRSRSLGAAGHERLLNHFSADRMTTETIAVYDRAIAHARNR